MRLLVTLLTMALIAAMLGFVLTNLETKVAVKIWETVYPDVPLWGVVLLAVVAGIVYAGAIALVEGATIRVANSRLEREVRRLETELTYLRTQPAPSRRPEPDALLSAEPQRGHPGPAGERAPVAAPVYDAGGGAGAEPDDDAYSGGRAV